MTESDVLDLVRENEEAVEVEKTIEGELYEEETVTEPEASNIEDTPTTTTEAIHQRQVQVLKTERN